MKRMVTFILAMALLGGLLACPAAAQWQPECETSAAAIYLKNLDTGVVVYEQNSRERRDIASLTKMMTALLLLESGQDLSTVITIPTRLQDEFEMIQVENGADADLQIGEEISLLNLLYCILLPSANDAASVIADYLSDGDLDAFAARMTERAAELGCLDTQFSCAHGLYSATTDNWGKPNYSTAYDQALIAEACYQYPQYIEVAQTPEWWLPISNMHGYAYPYQWYPQGDEVPEGMSYKIGGTNVMVNPKEDLFRDYVRGMKTGYTDEAGRCFASCAEQDGEHWLLVVLGAPKPLAEDGYNMAFHDTANLYDWVLQAFAVQELPESGTVLAQLPLAFCAESEQADLVAVGDVRGLVKLDEGAQYRVGLDTDSLTAPVSAGQTVGSVEVLVQGESLGSLPLAVAQDYAFSRWLYGKYWCAQHRSAVLAGLAALVALVFVLPAWLWRRKRRRADKKPPNRVLYGG